MKLKIKLTQQELNDVINQIKTQVYDTNKCTEVLLYNKKYKVEDIFDNETLDEIIHGIILSRFLG